MQPDQANQAAGIRVASKDDAAGIARVHSESWRDAYAGLLPDAHLVRLAPEALAIRWARHLGQGGPRTTTIVAHAGGRHGVGDEVVGFAEFGRGRERRPAGEGEVFMIYVATDWRERGIGRQLVGTAFHALAASGSTAATIWCLQENRAGIGFYRRLGGKILPEMRVERVGGTDYPVVGFFWPLAAPGTNPP